MRTAIRRTLPAVVIAAWLTGCSVGPDYHPPRVDVPGAFGETATTRPTTQAAAPPLDLAHWWEALRDPELNALLDRAEQSNLDLQAAVTRLQQARTAEEAFFGGALPTLKAAGVAGIGTGTSVARGGQIDGPLNAATNTGGLRQITHALGVDTQFELDVFGHLRRAGQTVVADAAAASEFRNQVLVTLLGDVARNYVQVRTLQQRLDIATANVAAEQRSADLEHVRFQRGIVNELDAQLADRELASVQATVEPLRARLRATERNLAVLLGQSPDSLIPELDRRAALPTPPAELGAGLPADLLRRRPDVRQAEAQLVAANARLGVAVSALYPRFFLNAAVGVDGQGLGRTPVTLRSIWDLAPSFSFPLLDFGQTDAAVQQQDQATRERLADYRKVILTAVQQVDDGLGNYDAERSRLAALARAVDAAGRAVTIANQRYDRGLTDFLNVLDAQRHLYALQDQYALSEDASVADFVDVCQALGGGWEGFAPPPPLRQPLPALLVTGRDLFARDPAPLDTPR